MTGERSAYGTRADCRRPALEHHSSRCRFGLGNRKMAGPWTGMIVK